MQIVKDHQITSDPWEFKGEDESLPANGNIIISVQRLRKDAENLVNRTGALGVRLNPGDALEDILPFLSKLTLVELYFPDMNDGRLFSFAWMLRNRHHYQGEIRASGNFIPEQAFYLSRVGINSFQPVKEENLPVTLANLKDFSVNYQPSVN